MPKQHQRYGLGNYGSCVISGANFDVISELDEIRTQFLIMVKQLATIPKLFNC